MDVTQRQITKVARAATRYATGALKKSGVGSTEYECLHVIRKNEGINQEQISQMLNIDKAAVTRIIHNLEKKGYAIRQKNPEDKRSNKIYSTEKALAIKFDETDAESSFYEWLMEEIAPNEAEIFLNVLEKLYVKSKNERVLNFSNMKAWESQRKKGLRKMPQNKLFIHNKSACSKGQQKSNKKLEGNYGEAEN